MIVTIMYYKIESSMSQKLFAAPRLVISSSRAQDSQKSPRRSLSPPRRHPNYFTLHQYRCQEGQLFTIIVYDKDHASAPYVHYWLVNVPGKQLTKGREVFKLEKIPVGSLKGHRYVCDVYWQAKGAIVADTNYSDIERKKFPVNELMPAMGNELISRQEFDSEESEGMKVFLT
jgi:phosphatidylethanolamine-binding protein (PEBP) family uncharacterized protein